MFRLIYKSTAASFSVNDRVVKSRDHAVETFVPVRMFVAHQWSQFPSVEAAGMGPRKVLRRSVLRGSWAAGMIAADTALQ